MSNFDIIKQEWATRKTPATSEKEWKDILDKSKNIHKKQQIGQVVLGITALVLILFFIYVSAYKFATVFLGLGIMIGSLLLRIGIEFFAMVKKSYLPVDEAMKMYNGKLIKYYRQRKVTHFIVTPILFGSYIVGFILLLPSFKESLSSGFYTYILISSCFIFIALALLIGTQIKKELSLFRELKRGSLEQNSENQ